VAEPVFEPAPEPLAAAVPAGFEVPGRPARMLSGLESSAEPSTVRSERPLTVRRRASPFALTPPGSERPFIVARRGDRSGAAVVVQVVHQIASGLPRTLPWAGRCVLFTRRWGTGVAAADLSATSSGNGGDRDPAGEGTICACAPSI